MADYAITGKKGTGKSLSSVAIMRDALLEGKKVATNLNVHLDFLMPLNSKSTITRLPDSPTLADLVAIGRGQVGVVEDENGIIVLDEVSHFFNAREFQQHGRSEILRWLTQSRKYGWDVYYIMQGLPQLDKQIRETQLEYHISIRRTDKWALPFITTISGWLLGAKNAIRFPKGILAITKYGVQANALIINRRFYRATKLYPAYDTQQLFRLSLPDRPTQSDFNDCSDALHTMLSAWHLKGRYASTPWSWALLPAVALYYVLVFCGFLTRTAFNVKQLHTRRI